MLSGMCFAFDAHPPDLPFDLALPPIAGGAGAEPLELQSIDAMRFSAALAESPQPKGPAVVVLPDVRGLYRFYIELAERFAQAGHHAVTFDYFGRTAGVGQRDEDFEWMPHILQTTADQVQADMGVAIAELRDRTDATEVVAVGFCFGGSMSLLASTNRDLGLAGAVGFYPGLDLSRFRAVRPLDRAAEMRGPLLGLFGGTDPSIPPDQIAEFDQRLTEAGVEHEFVTYPDAPHSFFDRSYAEHADACEDAWRRVLGFLDAVAAPA
jgi:carboxymethylenebutenolidase